MAVEIKKEHNKEVKEVQDEALKKNTKEKIMLYNCSGEKDQCNKTHYCEFFTERSNERSDDQNTCDIKEIEDLYRMNSKCPNFEQSKERDDSKKICLYSSYDMYMNYWNGFDLDCLNCSLLHEHEEQLYCEKAIAGIDLYKRQYYCQYCTHLKYDEYNRSTCDVKRRTNYEELFLRRDEYCDDDNSKKYRKTWKVLGILFAIIVFIIIAGITIKLI